MTSQDFRTVLFKVFMTIFIATAAITLLGVTGVIQIKVNYLNTLFGTLVVELICAVIALFRSANFFGESLVGTTSIPAHKLPNISSRKTAIDGVWNGILSQDSGPGGQSLQAKVVFTFSSSKTDITGTINFQFTRPNGQQAEVKFEFAGGFLFEHFLRLEYNSSELNKIQFGSIILELEPNSKELNGRFQGFGIESKKIVYGAITLRKVN